MEVPVLIATVACTRCKKVEEEFKRLGLPYEVKMVPQDKEATTVARNCRVTMGGTHMYYPSNLSEVFTTDEYIESMKGE